MFQPFLRFYPPTADPRIPTRHATEVSTLLEILPWAYIPLMAFALRYKVSTLLEILRGPCRFSGVKVSPSSFQPFLRFYGGQEGGGDLRPHVSTLLEILHGEDPTPNSKQVSAFVSTLLEILQS